MPVLVLPREVPGANAFRSPGVARSLVAVDDDAVIVLVVPSFARVLQAAWLRSLHQRPKQQFVGWLEHALGTRRDTAAWRYDRTFAAWVAEVGPERTHLVAGEDPAEVQALLTGIAGRAVPVRSWSRRLTWAEVAAVGRLAEELTDLQLTGRNATDLLTASARALVSSAQPGSEDAAGSPLTAELEHRLLDLSGSMARSVEDSGAAIHGDATALRWRASTGRPDDAVPIASAVRLSLGVLDRVATWDAGTREET